MTILLSEEQVDALIIFVKAEIDASLSQRSDSENFYSSYKENDKLRIVLQEGYKK